MSDHHVKIVHPKTLVAAGMILFAMPFANYVGMVVARPATANALGRTSLL